METLTHKLGLGCSGAWGMSWFPEEKAIKLIHLALEKGICEFDTGNFYCNGNAERRLGLALKDLPASIRQRLKITSKTGTQQTGARKFQKDFSEQTIRQDVTTSLERLNLERLDCLYLHGPSIPQIEEALPTITKLQDEGLVRHLGICSVDDILEVSLDYDEFHYVMSFFNLFNHRFLEPVKKAKALGKKTVAIAPLAQGLYRRKLLLPTSSADVWYLARAVIKNWGLLSHAQKQKWLHCYEGWTATQIVLRYVLEQDFIDVALFNTTKPQSLCQNTTIAQMALPAEINQRIVQYLSEA